MSKRPLPPAGLPIGLPSQPQGPLGHVVATWPPGQRRVCPARPGRHAASWGGGGRAWLYQSHSYSFPCDGARQSPTHQTVTKPSLVKLGSEAPRNIKEPPHLCVSLHICRPRFEEPQARAGLCEWGHPLEGYPTLLPLPCHQKVLDAKKLQHLFRGLSRKCGFSIKFW